MKYPADIVTDDGRWGRIHKGHGLCSGELQRDLEQSVDLQLGEQLETRECHLRWIPRLMWCADYGGCELEGEWHSHWVSVQPSPEAAFTIATWEPA